MLVLTAPAAAAPARAIGVWRRRSMSPGSGRGLLGLGLGLVGALKGRRAAAVNWPVLEVEGKSRGRGVFVVWLVIGWWRRRQMKKQHFGLANFANARTRFSKPPLAPTLLDFFHPNFPDYSILIVGSQSLRP